MKNISVAPVAKHWIKAFESAEKAVEAMRVLVRTNAILLNRNRRLREEIQRLTRRRGHARNSSSV
ncbi:MAG TPA: hypothetical protein VGH50_14955 [Candidatus Binatia bacterium]|jgi:hypothetical protein